MSLIDDALNLHADLINEAAGEWVSYIIGDTEIHDLVAVRGRSEFEEFASESDARILSRMVDWIVRADEMVDANGTRVIPERGAQIETGDGQVFEVLPGPDGNHWRWSEARQYQYRIHTVRREPGE